MSGPGRQGPDSPAPFPRDSLCSLGYLRSCCRSLSLSSLSTSAPAHIGGHAATVRRASCVARGPRLDTETRRRGAPRWGWALESVGRRRCVVLTHTPHSPWLVSVSRRFAHRTITRGRNQDSSWPTSTSWPRESTSTHATAWAASTMTSRRCNKYMAGCVESTRPRTWAGMRSRSRTSSTTIRSASVW